MWHMKECKPISHLALSLLRLYGDESELHFWTIAAHYLHSLCQGKPAKADTAVLQDVLLTKQRLFAVVAVKAFSHVCVWSPATLPQRQEQAHVRLSCTWPKPPGKVHQFLFITSYLSFNPTFSQINEHNRKKRDYKFCSAGE